MKFILNNLELKILALFSALVLWFFVVGIENTIYLFPEEIEITYTNLSEDLGVISDLGKAKVRVRTEQEIFNSLTKGDFEVYVDLKNLHAGEYKLALSGNVKNDKATIVKIEPTYIIANLEIVAGKEVAIKTSINGKPQKGYVVENVKYIQQTAKIEGAKSIIDGVNEVFAEVILDSSETTNFNREVNLMLPPNVSKNKITIVPKKITVEVSITQALQQKTVIIKPNIEGTLGVDSSFDKIEITPLIVIIQGKEEDLKNIDYLETELISAEELQGKGSVELNLILPKDVSLLDDKENKVLIELKTS